MVEEYDPNQDLGYLSSIHEQSEENKAEISSLGKQQIEKRHMQASVTLYYRKSSRSVQCLNSRTES